MTTIERHNPDGISKLRVHLYNHCARVTTASTTLYLAGQLARDENGKTVGAGDIKTQTEHRSSRTCGRSCGRRGLTSTTSSSSSSS